MAGTRRASGWRRAGRQTGRRGAGDPAADGVRGTSCGFRSWLGAVSRCRSILKVAQLARRSIAIGPLQHSKSGAIGPSQHCNWPVAAFFLWRNWPVAALQLARRSIAFLLNYTAVSQARNEPPCDPRDRTSMTCPRGIALARLSRISQHARLSANSPSLLDNDSMDRVSVFWRQCTSRLSQARRGCFDSSLNCVETASWFLYILRRNHVYSPPCTKVLLTAGRVCFVEQDGGLCTQLWAE
eukprot:scaffold59516_cov62-Phaeocystis_antarctica.AAC.1